MKYSRSNEVHRAYSVGLLTRAVVCALTVFVASCAAKQDFLPFLASEVASLGGKKGHAAGTAALYGTWTIHRDEFGAAITTKGIGFEAITNVLTKAYGQPRFYCPANKRHGPTYVYPATNAGIAIFVSSTKAGAEVTLTKPLDTVR
jgi:hypothetical protein